MDHQDSSTSIYSEAKSEYTRHLVYNFQPVLLRFFLDRFNETKSLSEFQTSLSQIPEWNLDKVQRVELQLGFKPMRGSINPNAVPSYNVYVFVQTYNVFRVYGGRAGLLFGY